MVYLITGPVGSGKSAALFNIFRTARSGDGFYNIRRYANGKTIGQDIARMSTGERIPFSRIDGFIPDNWDEDNRYMNYSFSKNGLRFAEHIVDFIVREKLPSAFIDELGPLEIKRQGLYLPMKRLLRLDMDIYAVCRNSCVDAVINSIILC